jgi:CelD/BcsL family acetyltransferase involved in cellulose biosynthesis
VISARTISNPDDIVSIEGEWDRLAVESRRPFCAPAWMMAWWTHAAPSDALLRVVVVEDGASIIGIAPLFAQRPRGAVVRYRFLSSPISKYLEPLAVTGRERDVAEALAGVFSRLHPRPDLLVFEGVPVQSRWPSLLREHWPARVTPWERNAYITASPLIGLADSTFDEWWATRSGRWRKDLTRQRRHLRERSVEFRLQRGHEAAHHVRDFAHLHRSRWAHRGGSSVLTQGVDRMLVEVAERLATTDRFRLWTMDADSKSISSHLFVAAGGEVAYWLGGFDGEWAWCSPAIQVILEAVRHSWESGDQRFILGAGAQPYKYRFATSEELLHWSQIAPRGPRYALTRLVLAPSQVRERLSGHLSENARQKIRRAMSRIKTKQGT